MSFNLVYYSQKDPKWKDDKLGFGTEEKETIGCVGCARSGSSIARAGGFGGDGQSAEFVKEV